MLRKRQIADSKRPIGNKEQPLLGSVAPVFSSFVRDSCFVILPASLLNRLRRTRRKEVITRPARRIKRSPHKIQPRAHTCSPGEKRGKNV